MKRWIAATVTGGVLAGGLALGAGVALADEGGTTTTPAPAPAPAGDTVCTVRIPKALARIDTAITRIGGDASVKGSTAWLDAKAQQARSTGHAALADLLTQRAQDRPQRVQELQTLTSQLQDVQSKDCAK